MIQVWHAINPTFGYALGDRPAPVWPDEYVKVAEVQTDDRDQAYMLTNHVDHPWYANPGVASWGAPKLRSTSMGDVLVQDGQAWICVEIGWQALEWREAVCPACAGRQFLISEVERGDPAVARLEIQRCDGCSALRFTDSQVREWPAAQAALKEATGGE